MSRSLTGSTIVELYQSDTTQAWLWLLTLYSPSFPDSHYFFLVKNLKDVVSRGRTFTAFPFDIVLPQDGDQNQPNLSLEIDNVDMLLVPYLRAMTDPAWATIELVALSRLDTPEITSTDWRLRNATWDAQKISFELTHEDVMHAKFPAGTYSPAEYPGLF